MNYISGAKFADLSVVVPCYNSRETILRAIRSVLSQSVLPREIVIVDDCSSDDTVRVLNDFLGTYKGGVRILIIENDANHGPSFSRNKGWDFSTCEFVSFLDSDDSWFNNKVEIQYAFMVGNSGCCLSGHKCSFTEKSDFDFDNIVFDKIMPWRILISNPYPTPSVMLRRDLPFRFDVNLKRLEDQLLWAEIALSGHSCYYSSTPLAFVHKLSYGVGGLSKSIFKMELGELKMYYLLFRKKYINFFSLLFFEFFSLCKFARRFFLYFSRKIAF